MQRRVMIVQARMASRRLPGKVLLPVAGKPLLERQLMRLRRCRQIDALCLATSDREEDAPIVSFARRADVPCYRGSADDVLARYVGAARMTRADVIVRVTADCPLSDPEVIDRIVAELCCNADTCDYTSNVLERTYPRGLDAEAFFTDTLLRMDRMAQSPAAREHVTLLVRSEHPEWFRVRSVRDQEDNADLRWTVDLPADLELIRRLHEELDLESCRIGYRDIVQFLRSHPELSRINAAITTWDPIGSTTLSIRGGVPCDTC